MLAAHMHHEPEPFFGAEYFAKLQTQLLSIPVQQLAESDGSWIRNIGFSIEATIMHAARRTEALERLNGELDQASQNGDVEASRLRMYCAQTLGTCALTHDVWQAMSQMAFTVFHIMPWSIQMINSDESNWIARMTEHYSNWLQIVQQILENHGTTLCRRLPTVIEDPATRQFRWGVPTLHAVISTEVLRNIMLRRTLVWNKQSSNDAAEEEMRLEQREQAVLGTVISKDASAVYGMMSEQHCLLQVAYACSGGAPAPASSTVPGTAECLHTSMQRACYGLAPILGFEEQALTQAMDMHKLVECIADMKTTAQQLYHAPLYEKYPPKAGLAPSYAKQMLLRTATALFNMGCPWAQSAESLAPANVPDISQAAAAHLAQALRQTAVLCDIYSLSTTYIDGSWLCTATGQLLQQPFVWQPFADDLAHILSGDIPTPGGSPTPEKALATGIEWLCEFAECISTADKQTQVQTQCEAAIDCVLAFYANDTKSLCALAELVPLTAWQAMGKAQCGTTTVAAVVWASVWRFGINSGINADSWQRAVALCCPGSAFLAYIVVHMCLEATQQLVTGSGDVWLAKLNQQGVSALRHVERTLTYAGRDVWSKDDLAFTPLLYTQNEAAEQAIQKQLAGAVRLLESETQAAWAQQLGLDAAQLSLTEADMRRTACLINEYVHGAAELLELLPQLLAPTSNSNVFEVPGILAKLPPIEASGTSGFNVEAAVRQWRRGVTQLTFLQARHDIQALVEHSYPSNAKLRLDTVLVPFMQAEPVAGVELVIGAIADFMWRRQIVYARRAGPFYAIRAMFAMAEPGPAAMRVLLLLTALRYGNSMRDTPIHMWLTDCLDTAPLDVVNAYFTHLLDSPSPVFAAELPVEPDWALKAHAVVKLWAGDRRLRSRPLVTAVCVAVVRHVLQCEEWTQQWQKWMPVIRDVLSMLFLRTDPPATDIVRQMLASNAAATRADFRLLQLLTDTLEIGSHDDLAFADSRDWFLIHVLDPVLEALPGPAARTLLADMLASSDALGKLIPWLDVAASLVQNVPLGHGCPVAMDPEQAKKHFVGYLSPLARVLLAIGNFIEAREEQAASEQFDWTWLQGLLSGYLDTCTGDAQLDAIDALLDVYTFCSVEKLRETITGVFTSQRKLAPAAIQRTFGRRPLDVFTLHSLRPQLQSSLPPLTPLSGDGEAPFRPGAEIYPLVSAVLQTALQDYEPQIVASWIEKQLWEISEEPDVRRHLIALKPRLIPKEHRPAASDKRMSQETVLQTTSASLHISTESQASAAAYALDRSVYLLGLLVSRSDSALYGALAARLAQSRVLLHVLMVAVGDSMRQFATLAATRELLTSLWAASNNGSSQVDGISVERVWSGVNFYTLAQRLNSQLTEEFTTWSDVQALPSK
ncbi:hypothetical protein IWW36_001235 [Coemansia brasiliensis]|uniref:Uncharacterized protein n=1 Tax=Coemansia brasiliensis TaxID=2650707 RepID=A0A9W8M1T4_9FUNG|nr:hypothetical protein IWW36_001235 [Coemansia brasiliensis]